MKRLCCVSRSLRWYVGVAAVVALAACDGGPKGPGVITASIVSPHSLGAVVVEVEGIGIEGFVGLGGIQAYGAEVSATMGRHRVVLVSAAGASIQFGIRVQDLGSDPPIASAVFAAGVDNLPKLLTGILVTVEN